MKIEYLHASKYGNGAMVAEEFSKQMAARGVMVDVHHIREARPKQLPPADLYLFSSPARFGKPIGGMRRFLRKVELPGGRREGPQDLETFQSNVHPAAGAHPDLAAVDHPRCAARFRAGHGRGIPRSARHQHAVDEVCAVITAIMGERDARADDQGERGEGSHQGETAVQTHDGDLQERPGRCPCDGSTAGRAGPFTVSAGRFRRRGERIGAGRRTPGQRTGRHRAVSSQAQ